jgi:alpha-beta hydrolase superfamily lysophospholipase
MTSTLDFSTPQGLRVRGTVLVVPGRGETSATYSRFGARIASDSYVVRVLPASPSPASATEAVNDLDAALTAALPDSATDTAKPLVLVGADTGAATLAALVARGPTDASWWPDALVLASLPGYGPHNIASDWNAELDVRSHCPAHRGVLTADAAVSRGALQSAVDEDLLDLAYGSTAEVPQLLVVGDADPLVDRDVLVRAAKTLPAARLSVVRGAHHDVLNDLQHRSVAAEVVTFLEVIRNGAPLQSIVHVESSAW